MKAVIQKIGYINCIVIGFLLFLWIGVFLIGGIVGAYSWTLLKLILPFIGAIGLLINVVIFIILLSRKRKGVKVVFNAMVNLLMFFPILMTMNIIPFAYPNTVEQAQPAVTVNFPLKEQTVIGWGGQYVKDNLPHAIWSSERWAYDLVMEPFNMNSDNNEDYGIWNKEVHSPVSGVISATYDGEGDITPGSEDFHSLEGNYVYIELEETGTYLLLNHLKKDSVVVKVGDKVKPGDLLGRVGNSGSSSEPHLHIHHQRQNPSKTIHPVLAEGLPLFFEEISGSSMPVKGDIIAPKTK
ncbi:peptidoglycan DD-metalloendopeptidase family protein [Peribacillus sp. NPDC097295]|uniref:peptidoglycan DD-metalloendopeptidase family protein n=1 Tax=Peribacillus sp. NPDC097295 TaxID=3364402 RepID=UPI0038132F0B